METFEGKWCVPNHRLRIRERTGWAEMHTTTPRFLMPDMGPEMRLFPSLTSAHNSLENYFLWREAVSHRLRSSFAAQMKETTSLKIKHISSLQKYTMLISPVMATNLLQKDNIHTVQGIKVSKTQISYPHPRLSPLVLNADVSACCWRRMVGINSGLLMDQ